MIWNKQNIGPFHVNSQEVVRSPSPIFLKFYSNCHYPIWWTSAKFEWNLSRNSMIIKLFSWGCLVGEAQIVYIWPCSKLYYCQTTFVNNPNFPGMVVTLPNIEKINNICIVTFKGRGHPKLTVLATSFRKFSNLATVLFLDIFHSYLEELLLVKLSLTLENFIIFYFLCYLWP